MKTIKFFKRDETGFWQPEYLQESKISKAEGVYCFDETEATNCCELTPSYFCHFVEAVPTFHGDIIDEQREEALEDFEMEAIKADDDGFYCHYYEVEQLTLLGTIEVDENDLYREDTVIDVAIDKYKANPFYC